MQIPSGSALKTNHLKKRPQQWGTGCSFLCWARGKIMTESAFHRYTFSFLCLYNCLQKIYVFISLVKVCSKGCYMVLHRFSRRISQDTNGFDLGSWLKDNISIMIQLERDGGKSLKWSQMDPQQRENTSNGWGECVTWAMTRMSVPPSVCPPSIHPSPTAWFSFNSHKIPMCMCVCVCVFLNLKLAVVIIRSLSVVIFQPPQWCLTTSSYLFAQNSAH